ncbi:MAG: CHP02436-containing protein [Candidatus Woesebacteria bacterium GW2011_GWA1_33_30]|uniref:CHP02436-containing protein n=1 Tax=Candidatus Woesebacteria bacterium GW2011_GWA2_33_28 TaxID=1618561 RepID=A0A0G0C5I7_9BACT|nr:MAG: CHP02436-containing protein [Candidatus Woesebacteria bacterium GW2011_GWA2_33_28]KKP47264.1 MAG: CHP02436-containing protein [Candidatus Woesebacteria bacterium GW2011_GWA1_33_30]KKP48910.1 MAG: CHP02436-containing protein [Microgenomates group bacterium GW2011_GWC1_33_32]KKP51448.1 MAG: CHP02436-containing protein [Candidatus Woesebacteria bacterium GW2011_GWB1_33_38]KKP56920.1 MAG: CHP02436-containing protein [Microgenomates group bacterium GW2011_GWD1_33_9]
MLRSGTSIGANIIEGQGSSSKKEFINFIRIAFKSAKETEYWLKLFKESKLTTNSGLDILVQESIEITNILNSSILTLNGQIKVKKE